MKPATKYKETELTWLYITVFTAVENWDDFFSICLKTVLKEIEKHYGLKNTILGIHISGHSHMNISLSVPSQNKRVIAKYFDTHVKNYLEQLPLEKAKKKPKRLLFMPIPSNSIRYGTYDLNAKSKIFKNLDSTLSKIITEIFKARQVSMNYLIVEVYALLLSALKYMSSQQSLDIKNIITGVKDEDADLEDFSTLYNEEDTVFNEIKEEIECFTLFHWMKYWKKHLAVTVIKKDKDLGRNDADEELNTVLFLNRIMLEFGLDRYLKHSLLYILKIQTVDNLQFKSKKFIDNEINCIGDKIEV